MCDCYDSPDHFEQDTLQEQIEKQKKLIHRLEQELRREDDILLRLMQRRKECALP